MKSALDRAIDELRDCLRLLQTGDSHTTEFTPPQDQNSSENIENVPEESSEASLSSVSIIDYDKFGDHLEYMEDLMARNLSERYERYIYNWFLENWPYLCFLAYDQETKKLIGAVVGKLDEETEDLGAAGYIAMLAVENEYRQRGIGKALISRFIESCVQHNAVEVYLETETINIGALRLYDSLGFTKAYLYTGYYENGNDAYYLRYFIKEPVSDEPRRPPQIDRILQEIGRKSAEA